jgi:hypothetical protein
MAMPVGLHHPTATPHRCPLMKGIPTMSAFIDLTGQPFGRLTVLSRAANSRSGRTCWLCQCTCGNTSIVVAQSLLRGSTTSCGCWMREASLQRSTKHGAATYRHPTPEYRIWSHMRQRCGNPRDHRYRLYGARGITVDISWLHDFPQFLADMGPRPSPRHSLERRNNDGPYSPDNCYWATQAQQTRNTRQNVFLTWDNQTYCLTDWAHILGITLNNLRYRLRHWPYDKVFTTPPQRHR